MPWSCVGANDRCDYTRQPIVAFPLVASRRGPFDNAPVIARTHAPHVLSLVAFVCYLIATFCLVGSMRTALKMRTGWRLAGLVAGGLAIVTHAIVLWHGVVAKPSFALTIAETASLVGLGVAVIAIVTAWRLARFAGTSAFLLALAGLVAAATNEGARQFLVANGGWELNAHIALSVLAYSLMTVGTALALALALLDRRLRKRQPLGWLSILPPVESLESGMFAALGSGFAVLSLALFSGFFFVDNLWAQSLSRKVALSVLAWVILGILLLGRWRFGWRGRMARNWTIGSYVALCLAYFGSKLVLESILGRHWG
jgi:ABC-type uncharacterized transport system permease subunit